VLWNAEFNYKQKATICPIIPVNSYIDGADRDEKLLWFKEYSDFTIANGLPVVVAFRKCEE